ncbi:MAG: hypothetical protein KAJ75_03700, partial [Alphaproteobacteria bacterium]|nr:hypothetical protein [Alphaproteobacteria bacterium]
MTGQPIHFKKKALLLKKETTYGEDSSPAAADVIRANNLSITPMEASEINRESVQPHFGAGDLWLTGKHVTMEFDLELSGSGIAGSAPAYASALLACGLAETIVTGEDTIHDSPATGSGTPTGSFTFAKGDAFTGDADRVVTLECTTAGASGTAAFTVSAPAAGTASAYEQTGVVMTDSVAFALPEDATFTPTVGTDFVVGDTFTINLYRPCAEYDTVSGSFDSASVYFYQDKVLHKMTGVRGNITSKMSSKEVPSLHFSIMGIYVDPSASALPEVDFSSFKDPIVHSSVNTPTVSVHGYSAILESAEFDFGQQVAFRQRVNDEGVEITDRAGSGRLVIEEPEIGDKDFYALVAAHTKDAVKIVHGITKGSIV